MKRVFLSVGIAFVLSTAFAQQPNNPYIVKTKHAQRAVGASAESGDSLQSQEKAHDFISENFHFYSLCDWKEGMRFMVMPEKYDMVVKTFHDASTGKEVSSMPLRYKIMTYRGHTEAADGRSHVNFHCEDNNHDYYYEIPNGTFDDYCYGKMGVPTLAFLGDVDIAHEKLMGKTLFTKATLYRIDTDYDGDGFQEVKVEPNKEVKVVAVGVGSRSFPVKIIVEDENGEEFYQNVAISKTNSGMRDDEFIMDNTKFLFAGSFELQDVLTEISKNYEQYVGKEVHTKYSTDMVTRGDGKDRTLRVPRMTSFTIEKALPKRNSDYVTLTLKEFETRRIYFKDVTFKNVDNVTGDIDGRREDYFGYLFAMGAGKARNTTQAARAAIRQGRVILNMTEDEVTMALGEPARTVEGNNGRHDWIYNRSNGKLLIVKFDGSGTVIGTSVDRSGVKRAATKKRTSTVRKKK